MGSCLSKKSTCSSSPPPLALVKQNQETLVEKKKVEGQIVRREIFVIKHRISHEEGSNKPTESSAPSRRTSSCNKDEVDTIVIQCGRLSRSSSPNRGLPFSASGEASHNTNRSRNYSISKKSWDFDYENRSDGSKGGSRRVSRSPVRRSESPIKAPSCANLASTDANGISFRPEKMVSVSATVSSLMLDKNADLVSTATIQRIQVKRNVGAGSPRARSRSGSPAKVNLKASTENMNCQQQPLYLSRSNSRKKEDSPFRRNPSSETDTPVVTEPMPFYIQKPNAENINNGKVVLQGTEENIGISKAALDYGLTNVYGKFKKQQQLARESKELRIVSGNAAVDMVASGFESLVPEVIRRSRSPMPSRDIDINHRVQSNPTQSYTELLLEDIQNFHQKSRNPSFSLPPGAVADFNSTTSSNVSSAFSEDRRSNRTVERINKNTSACLATNPQSKNRLGIKNPYAESEVAFSDDSVEPSRIQKYATFGRGTDGGSMEELESSESNSFVGYQRCRFSSSSQEPNSADSTDSWTPKSYSRLYMNPLAFQKCTVSDHVPDMDEGKSRMTANKRDSDNHQHGIVHNSSEPRGLHITPVAAAAALTY
ncbi:hypothetical protein R3W88_004566 [Solanum pinnatisectum]|uniref:Uncharacterized protein n=1 Tax=Solanum pinnatisectum TaxID=50273 RepID=A0AAV9KB07_9SOLN|nr:hypothetical protein R3W88_004566 [Solanum pinnatisectum]